MEDHNREGFEERVFNRRFVGSIEIRDVKPWGKGPVPVDCPTKAEFLKRRSDRPDDYQDDIVSAMWWAWKEAYRMMGRP